MKILFFVDLTLAELKKCSNTSDKHLELCVKGKSVLEWIFLTHLLFGQHLKILEVCTASYYEVSPTCPSLTSGVVQTLWEP